MAADTEYDEYWCVCDVDDTSAADLKKAQQKAGKVGMGLAISCRSFEVWLASHWGMISTAEITSERQAILLVQKHHRSYSSRSKFVPFDILLPKTGDAITNSAWLQRQGLDNPSTSVHILIEKLFQRLRS
jgi:hypothetical protein